VAGPYVREIHAGDVTCSPLLEHWGLASQLLECALEAESRSIIGTYSPLNNEFGRSLRQSLWRRSTCCRAANSDIWMTEIDLPVVRRGIHHKKRPVYDYRCKGVMATMSSEGLANSICCLGGISRNSDNKKQGDLKTWTWAYDEAQYLPIHSLLLDMPSLRTPIPASPRVSNLSFLSNILADIGLIR
jgi:hypothetical protein